MKRVSTSPDEYLASLPAEVRGDMETLERRIAAALPGHRRSLWEGVFRGGSEQAIIGYGGYTYVRSDKKPVEWFIVGLARQKIYYSVYVNAATALFRAQNAVVGWDPPSPALSDGTTGEAGGSGPPAPVSSPALPRGPGPPGPGPRPHRARQTG